MKLIRSLKLILSGDVEAQKLFDPSSLDRTEDAATIVAVESSGLRKVAAGAVGVPIPLGGVASAGFLLIASDTDIVVRLNSGSENIAIKKPSAGGRGLLYLEGAISAVVVDNPGPTDATVLYALAGV